MATETSTAGFLGRLFGRSTNDATKVPAPAEPASQLSPEAQILFDYKSEALALAKASASAQGNKPTMTDYFIATQQIGEKYADQMAIQGVKWTPTVIADLSGQRIDGFQINKSDMQPSKQTLMAASLRASQSAQEQGRKPTLSDTLAALQQVQQSKEKLPSIESMKDMMDLDGDHAISSFFAAIDHHADFKGTVFSNVDFHPAGTLMRDGENGVALTEGASFNNVKFDGMGPEDALTLSKGNYQNIHFTNIKGGSIAIADGTMVDGMDIRGAYASLSIGRASLSNLDATGAHIVHLDAAPGAQISQANFEGATIDMASNLQGSTWKNVAFTDANLIDVDMSGAALNNVRFNKTAMAGLDLSGATLNNVIVNGKPIESRSELAALGVTVDDTTKTIASSELVAQYKKSELMAQVTAIGDTLTREIASIGSKTEAPAQRNVPVVEAGATTTGIHFGGHVESLADATLSTAVAANIPRTQPAPGEGMIPGMPLSSSNA